ncbi:leucine-rich repeat and coiled-coil domain-containing protein PF3D7_0703800-like [Microplitis demolitor]|nr:leucine-rich repeat and coiled-coil domain-containing protein PF3D7_0703800-like [Microplitis demolitor]
MPGPFDQSNYSKLQAMVKNCAKPSSKWPDYNVEIRGRANSYEEAEERLKILNKELYAFTTENEDSAKLQASKDLKLLKMKSNKKNIDNLQKELNTFEVEFDDTEPSGRKNSSLQLNDKRKGKKNDGSFDLDSDDNNDVFRQSTQDLSHETSDSSPPTSRSKLLKRKRVSPRNKFNNKKLKLHNSAKNSSNSSFNSSLHDDSNSKQSLTTKSPTRSCKIDKFKNSIKKTPVTCKDSIKNMDVITFFTSISKQISQLNSTVVQITAEFNQLANDTKEIKNILKKKCFGDGVDGDDSVGDEINEPNNVDGENQNTGKKIKKFDFPIDDNDTFIDFNNQLESSPTYRKQVIKRMSQLINKNNLLNKNMTTLIKVYISRKLAILYVPSKSVLTKQKKPVFKNTKFYKCIEEVMRQKLKNSSGNDLTDKDILDAMSLTIRNARDWDGHRLLRLKKLEEPADNEVDQ